MTGQKLGTYLANVGNNKQTVAVWVIWLDDPNASIKTQLPTAIACPNCSYAIVFTRDMPDHRLLNYPKLTAFALRCPNCHATLRFDRTAAAKRVGLAWLTKFA